MAAEVNGENGRDPATGKFLPGNRLGTGNPHARRLKEYRQAIVDAVTVEDIAKAVSVLKQKAFEDGDLVALRELLDRTIGKPARTSDQDESTVMLDLPRLDSAASIAEASSVILQAAAAGSLPVAAAVGLGGLVELSRRSFETLEIAQRIEKLEQEQNG